MSIIGNGYIANKDETQWEKQRNFNNTTLDYTMNIDEAVTKAESKIRALWVYASGGYVLAFGAIVVAVLK
jgi:hypothetical protein